MQPPWGKLGRNSGRQRSAWLTSQKKSSMITEHPNEWAVLVRAESRHAMFRRRRVTYQRSSWLGSLEIAIIQAWSLSWAGEIPGRLAQRFA